MPTLNYVFVLPEERFAFLLRIKGLFEAVEIDFENGESPVRLTRARIATPGIAVSVPGDSRKLHVQVLRASVSGTQGPLLIWLGQKRLLAFLEEDDGCKAQLVTISDLSVFRRADGQLDETAVRADARTLAELAKRIQAGFSPGDFE